MGDAALADALSGLRLQVTGGFRITDADALPRSSGSLLLISPSEPDFWPYFTTAPEYADGQPDPMDRWSRRIGDGLARDFGALALYPFGGAPFLPFYTWALRSGRAWASPIGFLVHDTGGLFISYRMALLVPWNATLSTGMRPCDSCTDQPCTTTCPIGAFVEGYDVAACKDYLHSPPGQDCMGKGCAARRACPVGQGDRLPAHAAFHMESFL
jgi:epoxyqueuosine reductase